MTRSLAALHGRALNALLAAHERDGLPSLPVWANVLRVLGDGVAVRDLPELTRLSKRAVTCLGRSEKAGWAESDGATARLSARGRAVAEAWPDVVAEAETGWPAEVRASLVPVVAQLPLEHPHFPAGYGTADERIDGGPGQDWKPVPRGDGDTTSGLPLSGLLSQSLCALTIEYEHAMGISLSHAANTVRHLRVEPTPMDELPPLPGVTGNGKDTLERHGVVVVTKEGRRLFARLTPIGERVRAAHADALAGIEARWPGADALRAALEAVDTSLDPDLADHPPMQRHYFR